MGHTAGVPVHVGFPRLVDTINDMVHLYLDRGLRVLVGHHHSSNGTVARVLEFSNLYTESAGIGPAVGMHLIRGMGYGFLSEK
jgi:hypothetical protein